MKIEHLLARHFYAAKQLTLQGIGTFSLSPDFVMPAETDKEAVVPQGVISFVQNNRATEDSALIDFIVQQTRKMKPLASSDLDSFTSLGSQFLNIGKPFKIEGIGILEKNQLGEYLFTQFGQILPAKAEEAPTHIKEKREENISFASEETSKPVNSKKIAAIAAALVVVAGLGWAGWYFFTKNDNSPAATQNPETTAAVTNPVIPDTSKKDTAAVTTKPDSLAVSPAPATGYNFKVVIKSYPTLEQAQKSFARLTNYGHKVLLYTADSVTYKIAMPFSLPLTDTTYAKDSLRKFFNAKTIVELK